MALCISYLQSLGLSLLLQGYYLLIQLLLPLLLKPDKLEFLSSQIQPLDLLLFGPDPSTNVFFILSILGIILISLISQIFITTILILRIYQIHNHYLLVQDKLLGDIVRCILAILYVSYLPLYYHLSLYE